VNLSVRVGQPHLFEGTDIHARTIRRTAAPP
jgi:hypothetical protein